MAAATDSYCSSAEQIQKQSVTDSVSPRVLCLSCKGNANPGKEWIFSIEDDHFSWSHTWKPAPKHNKKSSSVKRTYGPGKKIRLLN
ncbi:hypothetical protein SUGI_0532220 [Cryptomeria japonica]|nr:hypothetical protein SUGI_0532220 [Cryptomeria japonica]